MQKMILTGIVFLLTGLSSFVMAQDTNDEVIPIGSERTFDLHSISKPASKWN